MHPPADRVGRGARASLRPPGLALRLGGALGRPVPLLASVVLAIAAADGAAAQDASQIEQGSFQLQVDGRSVGTESFALRREGDLVRSAGRVQLEGEAGPFRAVEVLLQTDPAYRPQLFRLQPRDGSARVVAAAREGDRIRLQTSTERGDRSREFVAGESLSVLEPHVIHHYALLLRQHGEKVADGSAYSGPVLLPSAGEHGTLTLEPPRTVSLDLGTRAVDARLYEVALPGLRVQLWTDAGGRLLRAAEAGGGWTATRREEERP